MEVFVNHRCSQEVEEDLSDSCTDYIFMMEMEEMGDIKGGKVVADCSPNKNEAENAGGFRNVRDRARDVKRDKIRDLERDRLRDAKRDEERDMDRDFARDRNRDMERGGKEGQEGNFGDNVVLTVEKVLEVFDRIKNITTPNINSKLAVPFNKIPVKSSAKFKEEYKDVKEALRKISGGLGKVKYHEEKERRKSLPFAWPQVSPLSEGKTSLNASNFLIFFERCEILLTGFFMIWVQFG